MNIVKTANNPQSVIQQLASTNPSIKQVMDYIQSNGGDAKSAFYKMAEDKGIDPNSVINALNN